MPKLHLPPSPAARVGPVAMEQVYHFCRPASTVIKTVPDTAAGYLSVCTIPLLCYCYVHVKHTPYCTNREVKLR